MLNEFVRVYKVRAGDCIQVRYQGIDSKYHNIIIDCGYGSTFNNTLGKEIKRLKSNKEYIDLFVLTHTHQDHIGGMKQFIRDNGNDAAVKSYWFNGGRFNLNLIETNKVSISQGFELEKYLIKTGKCNSKKIIYDEIEHDIYGAIIKIIGPRKEILDKFLEEWKDYDYSDVISEKVTTGVCDWSINIKDFNLDRYNSDESDENKVSITFIMEVNNKTILFLSDSHADEVEKTLRDMGYSKENRIDIDYMKISHHASKGNISDGMLDLIKCNKYIISTNGTNRDKFPHKETFARILRHPLRSIDDKIQFIFNYDTNELKNIFYDEEYELYNFECIYPKGGENNVTIPI